MPASASDRAKSKESCYGSVSPQTHYFQAIEVISPSRRWASQGRVKLFSKFLLLLLPLLAALVASRRCFELLLYLDSSCFSYSLVVISPLLLLTSSASQLLRRAWSQHCNPSIKNLRYLTIAGFPIGRQMSHLRSVGGVFIEI